MLSADQSVSDVAAEGRNFLKQVDSSPRTVEFAVGSGIRNPLIISEPVAEIYVSFHKIIHLLIPYSKSDPFCLHWCCSISSKSNSNAYKMNQTWYSNTFVLIHFFVY